MNARSLIFVFPFALWAVAWGCSSGNRIERCGLIPADGCPVGRGGTCKDETCPALYDCVDGSWTLVEVCEPIGGGGAASSSVGGGGSGGVMCNGVTIDRTGESQGCEPPLQSPDCPAAAAELCRPCDTGCVDFYLCKRDGWHGVAFCDEDGHVVIEP